MALHTELKQKSQMIIKDVEANEFKATTREMTAQLAISHDNRTIF